MHSTILPTTPGALLGYTSKGAPIRLMAGGSGDGDQGAGQAGGTDGDTNAGQAGTDQGTNGTGTGQQNGQGDGQKTGDNEPKDVKDLPKWAQDLIRTTRKEAADNRTKATTVETATKTQLDQIALLLGLKKGEELDPAKLAAQLDSAQTAERDSKVELAVYRTAGKHGGDPDALLDSRAFLAAVKELDPKAADFAAKVEAAIKDTVAANPKLKAQPAGSARSGGDMPGGPGKTSTRPTSLHAAVGKALGGK